MGIGTFGSFTQARLAIYAAQTGLTVTGNNISNVNTAGYTRQRLNQVSLYTAGSDRYYAEGDIRTGQGALVKSISQIRNPYLDIRYREENATVGYMNAQLEGLDAIRAVLDEVGKGDASKQEEGFGVLAKNISDLFEAVENLVDQTGQQEYDNSVKAVAQNLTNRLHSYAARLEEIKDDTITQIHEDVDTINGILTSIRTLNEEIRKSEIHGDPALELRDERNRQIDELSGLIDIDVTYSEEEISAGLSVEKLTIRLGNANPDGAVETDESLLVDGVFCAQLRLEQVPQEREIDLYDKTTWPYADADGHPVMTKAEAALVEKANPALKDDPTAPRYLDKDGNPTDDPTKAALVPKPNDQPPTAYVRYLKANGEATDKAEEAKLVDNPNYNFTITALKNKIGELHYSTNKYAKETVLGTDDSVKVDETAAPATPPAKVKVADLFGKNQNTVTITEEDKPGLKDTTITIYTRVQARDDHGKPLMDPNDNTKPLYTYTKQVFEQVISRPVALDDNDLGGELQGLRELLTEKGSFTDTDVISGAVTEGAYRTADENAGGKRGIQYYQRSLDLLANQFAKIFNDANQGFRMDSSGNYITKALDKTGKEIGVPITVNAGGKDEAVNKDWGSMSADAREEILNQVGITGTTITDVMDGSKITGVTVDGKTFQSTDILNAFLKGQTYSKTTGKFEPENREDILNEDGTVKTPGWGDKAKGIFDGAVLFSNSNDSDDTTHINASNIAISKTWFTTPSLVCSFTCGPGELEPPSGQSDNISHMGYLLNTQKWDFVPNTLLTTQDASDEVMFNGTVFQMWNDIGSTLGQDQSYTETELETAYQSALAIDTERDSVSSVDFNDEAMNLMMYAKSYNAACRLMTTIDSVLDKLINNTGMTT